jgi:hypothetical protein
MAFLSRARPPIPSIEQSARTPSVNYHAVDRHSGRLALSRRLHLIHDQQHHIRRMAPENQFHRRWRGPITSDDSNQSGATPHITLPLVGNPRVQPMVPGRRKRSRGRPLPGRQPFRQRTNKHPSRPLPLSASSALQNCSSTQRDNLMADLTAASTARETAVGQKIHKNEARAWDRYTKWCEQVGLGHDLFLDGSSKQHRIDIMGAFAVAIRDGWFSRRDDDPLAQKTVNDTLNFVAATF